VQSANVIHSCLRKLQQQHSSVCTAIASVWFTAQSS